MTDQGPREERLRFADFSLERLPNGRCQARVRLTWREAEEFRGEAEGLSSAQGELRCAAVACIAALEQAIQRRERFELLGVKAVRAFDAMVVIVSVAPAGDEHRRLVGSYLTQDDLPRAAALAVLHATNRLLGNFLHVR